MAEIFAFVSTMSDFFRNFARLKCIYSKNETIKDSEKYHEP